MNRKSKVGITCLVLSLTASSLVYAGTRMHWEYPAITCIGNGFNRSGSTALNTSGTSQWLMCPLMLDDSGVAGVWASVDTSPSVGCWMNVGDAVGNVLSYPASTTRHFNGFDENSWAGIVPAAGTNASIQCSVGNQKFVTQYFVNTYFEFRGN